MLAVNKEVIQTDSIDINTEYLKRPELLEKLTYLVAQYRFVRLTSPASSGKSTLLKMFQQNLKKTNIVWISCLDLKSCTQLLLEEGIDFLSLTLTSPVEP